MTFNSTLRLKESATSVRNIVRAQCIGKIEGVKNMMGCGNIMGRFTKSIITGRRLIKAEPSTDTLPVLYTLPVLLSNVSNRKVTMSKNTIVGHVLTVNEIYIIDLTENF